MGRAAENHEHFSQDSRLWEEIRNFTEQYLFSAVRFMAQWDCWDQNSCLEANSFSTGEGIPSYEIKIYTAVFRPFRSSSD
jgi:hypothetical protein